MSPRKIKYILLPVLALFTLAIIFQNLVSADSNIGEFISAKKVSAKIDGKNKEFLIEKYKKDEDYQYILAKNAIFSQKKSIELNGFEGDISICNKDTGIQNTICLIGDVGVHSQNLEILKYQNGRFINLPFYKDGASSNNISTDVPNYSFETKNGSIYLVIDQRDYDTDPINNAIRNYYKATDSGFVFDGTENITYNDTRIKN